MENRTLGKTGRSIKPVGLGCWQLGADWGHVGESEATAIIETALASGVTFFDTADVYGDGRSEQLLAATFARHGGPAALGVTIATKMGRRLTPLVASGFTLSHFREWTDRSRRNLRMDTLDLVQLHCPPSGVLFEQATYDALDTLVEEGAIAAYGVSVETCDEALEAMRHPGVATIQIIINAFRLKPIHEVLPVAREGGVGIIARVPLASGLLSGKYDTATTFAADDHRTYNRDGSHFDVGETFSGVPYEVGIEVAQDIAALAAQVPSHPPTAALALRWLLDQNGVSVAIPGARSPEQVRANVAAGDLAPLPASVDAAISELYDARLRDIVHHRW